MDRISFEDFQKLDIRVAKVIKAEEIEGADKLLKLTLDVGELGERTVVAGIKKWYEPKVLVGKLIVYLSNLEPKELRGIESEGMLLAAGEDVCVLINPDNEIEPGSKVH